LAAEGWAMINRYRREAERHYTVLDKHPHCEGSADLTTAIDADEGYAA
jgi:hypothetical protein